jgi:hypothetical protein
VLHRILPTVIGLIALVSLVLGVPRQPISAAPADIGYRDFQFGASCNSTPTGEKPESKLWWNDGFWWGSLCTPSNIYHIHRFDVAAQRWIDTGTPLDDRPSSKADTLWDGQKLYVASHPFSNSGSPTSSPSQWGRLYRYSYDVATKTYRLDSSFPVPVTRGPSETLVLEKTPSGQLWVTYTQSRMVMVNHSVGSDGAWATPFVLPVAGSSNLTSDDIASIITFDRGTAQPKVGVLWSNENDKRMYFAAHVDGAATTAWASFSLLVPTSGNPAAADDHVNIKLQSDGSGVYAVTKTSNEGATEPLIVLLSCRSACSAPGNWQATPVYNANERHTRAILLLDTTHRKVNVFTTTPETGGSIHRAIYTMDTLSSTSVAESKTVFIQNAADTRLNNATSTKQTVNSTTGLLILAGDQESRFYLHNYDALAQLPPATPTLTPTLTPTFIPTRTPGPAPTPIGGGIWHSFLPLIHQGQGGSPDLVGRIALAPDQRGFAAGEPVQINVTITNIGNAPSEPAWVDLYINPSVPPATSGTPWNAVCGLTPCFGLVWVVPALASGQQITLSSAAESYAQPYTIWPGWFAQGTADLYLYVDSWNPGAPDGAVVESSESNNRSELHGLRVVGTNPSPPARFTTELPARPLPE